MTRDGRRLSSREYSHASGLAASIALKASKHPRESTERSRDEQVAAALAAQRGDSGSTRLTIDF